MQDLTSSILELIRQTATDLPPDVEARLRSAVEQEEPGSAARGALETILENVDMARQNSTPICQDTGTPLFDGISGLIELHESDMRESGSE